MTSIPDDHRNFSFVPSSPTSLPTRLPSEASTSKLPYTSFSSSIISPDLTSNHSNLSSTSQIISQSISSLGPRSPSPPFSGEDCEMDDELMSSSITLGKRTAGLMEEDIQRRGPANSITPGGDCKSLCVRHQRMANGGTNFMLQKSIENLPPNEQTAVNTIWSLFSSSPSRRRHLILQGLLTIACPSQLTFLQDALTLEMRLDPLDVLPREVSLKLFSYLDAISLGRAAQVSKLWRDTADDDLLWRTMCEQHIEKKCAKCGWGLPLLAGERRRKAARGAINSLPTKVVENKNSSSSSRSSTHNHADDGTTTTSSTSTSSTSTYRPPSALSPVLATEISLPDSASPSAPPSPTLSSSLMSIDSPTCSISNSLPPGPGRPTKRAKTNSPAPSRSTTPGPTSPRSSSRSSLSLSTTIVPPPMPSTRPWKSVYCERLAVERNWRKGTCISTVLSGHTDSITCLQVAEDLPDPNFPVLMTGSWDRSVRIWNLETGKEVGVLRGHTRGVRALQFDALKLVTGSMDSTLKIWNWRTGECVRTLRGHREGVISLTYDKQLLISGSADATVKVWDFGTGEVYTLLGHTEWVNSVAIWDSKAECGTGGAKDTVLESDIGTPLTNPELAKASSKGKFLFSASDDMTIRVWDLYTRECVRTLSGHVAQVQSLRVITAEEDRPASFPNPTSPPINNSNNTNNNSNDPRNRQQVLDGNAYDGFFDQQSQSTNTTQINFQPASLSPPQIPADSSAIWRAATQNQGHPNNNNTLNEPTLTPLAFEGGKKPLVISSSLDNTIKVWDVEAGQCQRTMFGHIEGVWDVDVDKLRIVSASHDRTLKIWDKESGRCLHTLVGHTSAVTAVTLQDQYVVTGGDDANVRVWNFARSLPSPELVTSSLSS